MTSCQEWIDRFREDYLQCGSSETTWKTDYQKILNRLPAQAPLTAALLHQTVLETPVNTKTRKRCCMVAGAIARFAGIQYDPSPYAGKYSPKAVQPRDLPSDTAIAENYSHLTNLGWKWVYGMIATYGLRPHEVFRLNLEEIQRGNPIVFVGDNTKTGSRSVWAFHPEWFTEFRLWDVQLPRIKLNRPNIDVGHSATAYFRGFGLPFHLYDLRHSYAIRATLTYGMDYKLVAKMMGHSYQVHEEIYHRWLNLDVFQTAYDAAINRSDRPLPPSVKVPKLE